jgi:lipoprotein-anchoring transpeptidase ErfK/SrfK
VNELQSKRPRHRIGRVRFWIVMLVAAFAVAFAYGGAALVGTRRADAVAALAGEATAAVAKARQANAMTWAPDELLQAESAIRQAATDHRVQLARLWPLPDLTSADAGYREAIAHATRALTFTNERRDAARDASAEALTLAAQSVDHSTSLAGTIHLASSRRTLLARARLTLDEARVFHREGDYGSATVSANQSRDLAVRVRDLAAEVAARYADEAVVRQWQRWKADTIAWSRRDGRAAVLVEKEVHRVTLYLKGEVARVYRADMGFNWVADKRHSGDGATPEGRYRITARKGRGATIYYKALLLDYPNQEDRREFTRLRRNGELPPSAAIGGLIEIHGEGGRGRDWTRGCVALLNADMDDLFARVEIGTPVTIVGSDEPGALAAMASRTTVQEGRR